MRNSLNDKKSKSLSKERTLFQIFQNTCYISCLQTNHCYNKFNSNNFNFNNHFCRCHFTLFNNHNIYDNLTIMNKNYSNNLFICNYFLDWFHLIIFHKILLFTKIYSNFKFNQDDISLLKHNIIFLIHL